MKLADHMIYLVTVAHQSGPYMPERDLAALDRDATIALIALGEWHGISQVLECNPVESICRDCTEDVAKSVMTIWAQEGEPLLDWQREFVEAHVGIRAANCFMEAAE